MFVQFKNGACIPKDNIKWININSLSNEIHTESISISMFFNEKISDFILRNKLIVETFSFWEEDYICVFEEIIEKKYFIKKTEELLEDLPFGTHCWGWTIMSMEDLDNDFYSILRRLDFHEEDGKMKMETKHDMIDLKISDEVRKNIIEWKELRSYMIKEYSDFEE